MIFHNVQSEHRWFLFYFNYTYIIMAGRPITAFSINIYYSLPLKWLIHWLKFNYVFFPSSNYIISLYFIVSRTIPSLMHHESWKIGQICMVSQIKSNKQINLKIRGLSSPPACLMPKIYLIIFFRKPKNLFSHYNNVCFYTIIK